MMLNVHMNVIDAFYRHNPEVAGKIADYWGTPRCRDYLISLVKNSNWDEHGIFFGYSVWLLENHDENFPEFIHSESHFNKFFDENISTLALIAILSVIIGFIVGVIYS